MDNKIKRQDLETWADYLLDHSLGGVATEDVVMVKGENITWPLMSVLQEKIIKAGAIPDMFLVPPDNNRGQVWSATMAREGTLDQIKGVPDWMVARYEHMTKYIEILGAEDPELFANPPEQKAAAIAREDRPLREIRLSKPWVLTLFPTQAFAEIENMSLAEYTDVILSTSLTDPKYLEKVEEPLYQLIQKSCQVRILTHCPDLNRQLELKMDIAERQTVKCTGKHNFPDGEVFTSPDANSVSGEIFIDLPIWYNGVTVRGIYLKLEAGRIVDYKADQEHPTLKTIIETDKGSRRIGEVALGMNQGLQTALKHPLFVEKVGGTLHIAIGSSYPECFVEDPNSEQGHREIKALTDKGIYNASAQHVDLVVDFREGGSGEQVFFDDQEVISEDNIWKIPA